MTTYIENKLINLNSENATQLNGDFLSSVQFSFVGLLNDDPTIRNVSISIQNAQFPYSFYNVNVYNNLLQISVDSNPSVVLTFTRGNYNATTFINEIKTQLTNAGITDITIVISSITGLLTFTKASGSFTLFSTGSTCFKLLGFNPSLNYTSTASVLVAPYPLNLLGTLKLRIASLKLSVNSIDSSVSGNLNILSAIPINAGNFGLIAYENTTNITNQLNLKVLDGFDLEILDDDGNLINFNGCYWTISMLLTIERDVILQSPTTFTEAARATLNNISEQQPQEEPLQEIPEEEIVADENAEIYAEAPDLEETIVPTDLDLLLYSRGIR